MSDAPPEFLTYARVRAMLGWKSNFPIRSAVTAGKLTRVYLSKSVKSARITAASVTKFLNDAIEEKATLKDFNVGAAQFAQWKQAKQHEQEAAEQAKTVDPSQVATNITYN